MKLRQALASATTSLRETGIDDPARDARRLLAHCLGIEPGRLTLHLDDQISNAHETAFQDLVSQRQLRKPISHLVGYRDFFGRRFVVNKHVLDPRGDTETLVELALEAPFEHVLDLGTGSGCILLTLLAERNTAHGIGTDISEEALHVAEMNAAKLAVAGRCEFVQSDWFASVTGRFDLIVSNPPYVTLDEMDALQPELSYEPRSALTDEKDGLTAYRILSSQSGAYLSAGGQIVVEIGSSQGKEVVHMFQESGFVDVRVFQDLDGKDRVVRAKLP